MAFEYHLEEELERLAAEIADGTYRHGRYVEFVVNDNKRRTIAVAAVRDRVVHRLLYEHLVQQYNKVFVYDVWSCRPGKGVEGAVQRVQEHMSKYRDGWLWRSDVTKFFDNVDHDVLLQLIRRRITGERALWLLECVITSYRVPGACTGLAIGNLTSQICANIYLNEYDRFVQHMVRPLGYVRYGDDMVLWLPDERRAKEAARRSGQFLADTLQLTLNPASTALQPVRRKLHYLGMEFWPVGHRLDARMRARLSSNVSLVNFASYDALAAARGTIADRHGLCQTLLAMEGSCYTIGTTNG